MTYNKDQREYLKTKNKSKKYTKLTIKKLVIEKY